MYIRPSLSEHAIALDCNPRSILNLRKLRADNPLEDQEIVDKAGRKTGNEPYKPYRTVNGHKVIKASSFPSVWARFLLLYYTLPGDLVLDPFGNRANIGYIAHKLRRNVILNDVVPRYVEFMRNVPHAPSLRWDCTNLDWGSDNLKFQETVQAIITSPPYWDLENYEIVEGQAADLKRYEDFLSWYEQAIKNCYNVLESGCFSVFVVSNFRRKKEVIPLVEDTVRLFRRVGFRYHDRGILYCHSALACLAGTRAVKNRWLVKMHEEFVVGLKP